MGRAAIGMLVATGFLAACPAPSGGGTTSSGGSGGSTSGGFDDGGCPFFCGGVCCASDQTCVATSCCDTAKVCGMDCCTDTADCQSPSSGVEHCADRCDDASTCGAATPCCEKNPSGAGAGGHCLPHDCGNECCPDVVAKCKVWCQHVIDCLDGLDAGSAFDCNQICGGGFGATCPDTGAAFDCLAALPCNVLPPDPAYTACANKANCPDAGYDAGPACSPPCPIHSSCDNSGQCICDSGYHQCGTVCCRKVCFTDQDCCPPETCDQNSNLCVGQGC